jgi:hypothetical protein
MSLENIPLFFHIVAKHVHSHVIIYNEIFQALVVEDEVLLSKPFLVPPHTLYRHDSAPVDFYVQKWLLDLGFDGFVRQKSPASKMFYQFAKNLTINWAESLRCNGWGWFQKWLR